MTAMVLELLTFSFLMPSYLLGELAHRGVVFAFDALNTQKKLANRL